VGPLGGLGGIDGAPTVGDMDRGDEAEPVGEGVGRAAAAEAAEVGVAMLSEVELAEWGGPSKDLNDSSAAGVFEL
jgi:hypothetical protein